MGIVVLLREMAGRGVRAVDGFQGGIDPLADLGIADLGANLSY
jgi:hypothetical protein